MSWDGNSAFLYGLNAVEGNVISDGQSATALSHAVKLLNLNLSALHAQGTNRKEYYASQGGVNILEWRMTIAGKQRRLMVMPA